MIKLLIVDDESFVRHGLINNVRWNELGIDSPEQADDGVNALEIALQYKPDILLSDIRMPRMDGIELAMEIKEKLPDCKLIFMSAYSDKEYLKSAIDLKAVGYIEKPINLIEVNKSIATAVAECNEEIKTRIEKTKVHKNLQESIHLIRNNIALELVNRNVNKVFITKWLDTAGIEVSVEGEFIVLISKFRITDFTIQNNNILKKTDILKKIEEMLLLNDFYSLSGIIDYSRIITVIYTTKQNSIYSLNRALLENSCRNLLFSLGKEIDIFFSIGESVYGIDNIYKSYQSAEACINELFFKGYGNIVLPGKHAIISFEFQESDLEEFNSSLEYQEKEQAIKLIREMTKSIKLSHETPVYYIKNIYFRIMIQLTENTNKHGMDLISNSPECFFWVEISEFDTLDELENFIINKIDLFFQLIDEKTASNKISNNILKIINKEYENPALSIKTISEKLFLSDVYLCIVFKKETGKTINQCITEFRVEKAKELLKNKHIKLYEVATSVGYKDLTYFGKIFKKVIHLTPKEYREKH